MTDFRSAKIVRGPRAEKFTTETLEGPDPLSGRRPEGIYRRCKTASQMNFEKKDRRRSGEDQYFSLTLSESLDVSEKFGGVVLTIEDITDKKRATKELRLRQGGCRGGQPRLRANFWPT